MNAAVACGEYVEKLKMRKLLRFKNLKESGVVDNRVTLGRRIKNQGFPQPIALGKNSVAWDEAEVEAWVEQRAAARSRAA